MTRPRTLITFGSGPGIGNHVSAAFASLPNNNNFNHIILLSRNAKRLQDEDTPFVRSKSSPDVKVDTLALDLADLDAIPAALKKLDELTEGEDVEVVFFNAARVVQNEPLATGIEELESDFRVRSKFCRSLVTCFPSPRLRKNGTEGARWGKG
jgi:short-subunit dehydrogenase